MSNTILKKLKYNTKKMNCLLALTHFKLVFHFYTPSKQKKHRSFDVFKKYGNVTLAEIGWLR